MMLRSLLKSLIRLIENLVIDKNRIFIGSLISLFFIFGYFLKLDYIILISIVALIIYDLYKSKFLDSTSDYLILISFVFLLPIIYLNHLIINLLNILIIILIFITIIFPNFYLKKIFLICILIFIHNFFSIVHIDRNLLYFTIFIAFFNDTIAYIFGKIFKGPLIIPFISPKKTWSGTGISFIASFILIYSFNFPIYLSVLLSISLFFGDIFFSYIKRKNELKDFSNILQNHGGILDRLDSMFFFIMILILT